MSKVGIMVREFVKIFGVCAVFACMSGAADAFVASKEYTDTKLKIDQGVANAGKVMTVNASGIVMPTDALVIASALSDGVATSVTKNVDANGNITSVKVDARTLGGVATSDISAANVGAVMVTKADDTTEANRNKLYVPAATNDAYGVVKLSQIQSPIEAGIATEIVDGSDANTVPEVNVKVDTNGTIVVNDSNQLVAPSIIAYGSEDATTYVPMWVE